MNKIYFIEDVNHPEFIKIGQTDNIERRIRELNAQNPFGNIRLLTFLMLSIIAVNNFQINNFMIV